MKQEYPLTEIDSIKTYNEIMGLKTKHPLVAVVNLQDAGRMIDKARWNYGLYALWIKHGIGCAIHYGRQNYDYQEGTVVSFAPGQVVQIDLLDPEAARKTQGLLFHPDLIYGTPLGEKIKKYSFFSYGQREALHLSDNEQKVLQNCLANIKLEMQNPVDQHSRGLLCDHIELFLDYCMRFYDRQFYTRAKVNGDVLEQFESEIESYLDQPDISLKGLPSVKYFADKACLTPGYFGDLIKRETGKTAQEYIQLKLIDRAKQLLHGTSLTVNQVADALGFQYPQHFVRMFKKQTGQTPGQFRLQA